MITYNIFDDMLQLRNVVNDFFNEASTRTRGKGEFPYVELYEGNDVLEVHSVLPGVEPGSINVELVDTSLIIEGEKKSDYADKPYIRKERRFGKFKKSIKLPYPIDSEKISAKLNNGILRIGLVKSEEAKPKKIEIN